MSKFGNFFKRIGKRAWGGIKKVGKVAAGVMHGVKRVKDWFGKQMNVVGKIPVVGSYIKAGYDTVGTAIDIADLGTRGAEYINRRGVKGVRQDIKNTFS